MAKNLNQFGVLFDLDGTLVDTAADLAASMNFALVRHGIDPVPAADVRYLVGHGAKAMLRRGFQISAGRDAADSEIDSTLADFLDHYAKNIAEHSQPFEGVLDFIEALAGAGAQFAICTNKREALAEALLRALGLRDLFVVVVGADTTEAAKPDPAPVRRCLEVMGVSQAVFIGDSDTDIRAAAATGLPCYVANFGYGPTTLMETAAGEFSSYADLLNDFRTRFLRG